MPNDTQFTADSLVQKDAAISSVPFPSVGWFPILSSGLGFASSGMDINPLSALQLSSVQACVDRISSDIAKLPIKLLKRNGDDFDPVFQHPLLDLLEKPNRRSTRYEWVYLVIFSYLMTGNGYCSVMLDTSGRPIGLIPLALNRCYPQENSDGSVIYRATSNLFAGYRTSRQEQRTSRRTIDESEMIHLRRMTIDGVRGTSVLSTATDCLGLALAAQTLASKTFANGATFSIALSTPMRLSKEQVAQTQEDFIRNLGGVNNAGRPPVMHGGTELHKISMSPEETQLLQTRDHLDAEICRLFGIPAGILGIGATGSQTNTYKNLSQDMEFYTQSTLMNIIQPFQDILSDRLLFDPNSKSKVPLGGAVKGEYKFEFDTTMLTRPDTVSRFSAYQTAVNAHVMTPNECRIEEGLPPLPDGDEFPDPKPAPTPINSGGETKAETHDPKDNILEGVPRPRRRKTDG